MNIFSGRLFHGWYVAATLALCGVALYGAGLYSFVLFVTPLSNEFDWSRAATGTLVSAFWLAAPLVLWADRLIKRFGVKRLIIAGIFIESACLIVLCWSSELWQMYVLRALAGLGKILYAITIPTILSRWFSRRFGLATAVVYSGWHIGGVALAPVTQAMIASIGWRETSVVLGIGIVIVALPAALWFLRAPSAASLGLPLDGEPPNEQGLGRIQAAAAAQPVEAEKLVKWGEVLRDKGFLLVSLGTGIYCLSYSGVLAHQAATIESVGISASIASITLSSTALFAIAGALLIGWLIDRFSILRVTLVQYGLNMAGIICLISLSQMPVQWLLLGHALLYGLAVGGTDVYWLTMLKRRVPEEMFSTAYGIWYFITLAGTVAGPGIAGWLYDISGSYVRSLAAELVNLIVPLVMCLVLCYRPSPVVTAQAAAR